ncbi:MAG: DUF642 domain-containing protein, partial [Thermoguttaceae bacterium]|nr:DUF642 domain-containing protein [Thermoguttaceae bacterium]
VNGAFEDSIAASGCYALGTGDNRIKGWSVTGTVFLHNQRVCREFSDVWAGESGNETFCVDLQRSYSGGTISQTFATVPGQRYVLTYVVAGNPRGGAAVKRYSISAGDSTFTGTFDTTGKSANNMGWESRTWSFVATAAQTTLAFTGLGYGDYGATIDDVCVAPALESTRYPTGYTVVLQNGQSANNRDFGAYRDPNTTQLNKPTITATATSFESIALTIGSVANASGYEVEYSTSPSFTESRTATQTFASAGKKTLTGLAAETTYYVRVKAIGKGTYVDSIWADATSATTWPPATQLSAPSLSVSAASSFSLNVAIGAVENASGYTLQYSTSSSFTSSTTATKAYSSAGTDTLTGLAANASYYVRVLAQGDGASDLDSEWSSVKSAPTPKAALTAVTISGTPKVGETLTANVSPSGATATFQWYCGANPNAITTVISGATSKTFAITSAYVGKYLKVVATGIGDYSGSVAATTAVAVVPNATRLATPTLNVVAESSSALSVTVGAVANATSHTLEYSTSQDFSASTTRRWTWLVAGTRELDGLSAGTTYYLRVRANGDGTSYRDSEWSSVKTATTKSVAANKPNLQPGAFETDWDGGIALSASYNDWPTRHATTFSVNDTIYICGSVKNVGDATAEPFAVEFALRDANGTPLQTYTWMRAEVPARHWYWARSAAWSFKNLAAGTYTVTATVDSKNVVAESDETDNVYVKTFRVVGAAKETPSLVVTTNLDAVDAYDGKISLREAILYAETNAALGDTITFAASTKGKTITLNGADLEVNRAGLKIDASSLYDAATETPGVTIDADGRSRGFNVKAGTKAEPVTIKGLTITGGSARDGGGIYVSEAGALALYDSALIGNRATSWGGGGLCADGPATVVNCRFVENEARDGGGLCVATGATLTLADSTFIGNAAFGSGWDGGAIRVYADCVATIDGCEIRENEAAKGGGISVATGGKATISNSTIADNVATVYGGGGLGI